MEDTIINYLKKFCKSNEIELTIIDEHVFLVKRDKLGIVYKQIIESKYRVIRNPTRFLSDVREYFNIR